MKLDAVVTRARYLALVLPVFAVSTTVHAGCNSGPNGLYYTTYGGSRGNRTPSTAAHPEDACVVIRSENGDGEEVALCDEDEGYGGGGDDVSGGDGGLDR
jgi:hypothetical protein